MPEISKLDASLQLGEDRTLYQIIIIEKPQLHKVEI